MKTIKSLIEKKLYQLIIIALLITSCSDDDNDIRYESDGLLDYGALILNEGTFGNSNASLSFESFTHDTVIGDIYREANGGNISIGDVLQDAVITDNLALFVLNNSDKIEVTNSQDFTWKKTIDNLHNPRFATTHNNKLFVSQWRSAEGSVAVIDLNNLEIIENIETDQYGAEGILSHNNYIWVANSGGFGTDNTISVIDPETYQVVNTIKTKDEPTHFTVDKNSDIWAVCSGSQIWNQDWTEIIEETPSYLIKIDPNSQEVVREIKISDSKHANHIGINKDKSIIYTMNSLGIFKMRIEDEQLPVEPFIGESGYSFSVNPFNGDIYLTDAKDFASPGTISIYDGNSGELKRTITDNIGLIPSKIIFR
ncbi:hypothetical protein QA597_01095 [Marinilabiliaceae bacterium ANBcel2]|nr:hypothetical protein [Marinilabiliaceae bacterium ANBcel2]